ncbi:hypothetical protein ACRCUN_08160 [Mycobacterium sp. LTG2003]
MTAFMEYGLTAECLLTWYPKGSTENLSDPKMEGKTTEFSPASFASPGLGMGTSQSINWGRGWSAAADAFDTEQKIGANITVVTPPNALLPTIEATLELYVGKVTRRRKLVLPPDTTTAFMLNADARSNEPRLADTAAVFQGVFITGTRRGLMVIPWLGRG